MNKQTQATHDDIGQLVEDVRAFMAATADVAGEKVGEVRQRLAESLNHGKEVYERARGKAVAGARAADEVLHEHPYQTIAIGLGLAGGALIGYLLARSRPCLRK